MHGFFGSFPDRGYPEPALQAEKHAIRAKWRAEEIAREIDRLEHRIDKLVLANMALFSLLEEKVGVTEPELLDRIREIDLRDGKLDGKVGVPVSKCPSCGRTMSRRHSRCLYCGAEGLEESPFL